MNYLRQFLRGVLNDPALANLAFAVLVGLGIALAIFAVSLIASAFFDPMRRRLRLLGESGDSSAAQGPASEPASGNTMGSKVSRLLKVGKGSGGQSALQSELIRAGYESSTADMAFHGIRFLSAVALPLLVLVGASLFPYFSVRQVGIAAAVAAAIGFLIPGIYLDIQESRRKRELEDGFPDALDLLVACTEAGMGLNAALQRVGEQLEISYPALAHQFSLVNYEIRGGVDRLTALRNLYERTGLEMIRSLVGILAQTLRYGTGVAETLRVFAEDLRDRRMQMAEEKAAKIGTKMIFPLILCIFPSFFLVAIGPAIIGVLRAFE